MRVLVVAGALLPFIASCAAEARSPLLNPQKLHAGEPLPAGVSEIEGIGTVYIPSKRLPRSPLLVLFHGAGMTDGDFIAGMKREAEDCGCALLAIKSREATWDLVASAAKGARSGFGSARADQLFGADADRVERGLGIMFARGGVDPSRTVAIGFSDGASYALSLALFNPALFRSVVAMAPGMTLQPSMIDTTQRIYVAHGRKDRVLNFAQTESQVVQPLRSAGFDVVFYPFDAGHVIDRSALRKGLAYVLGTAG